MAETKKGSINLLFGLPADQSGDEKLISDFLSAEGVHIVCGGSTATRVASHLGRSLSVELYSEDPKIPPKAHIDGITLVTEGILTMRRVLALLNEAENGATQCLGKGDGASQIVNCLIGAENICFHVGLSESPEKNALGLYAAEKAELISAISEMLIHMGKTVKTVIYP